MSPSPSHPSAALSSSRVETPEFDEWIVTDGAGGFASSTPSMRATRRYHGLLVKVLPGTAKRYLFVAELDESVRVGEAQVTQLGGEGAPLAEFAAVPHPRMQFTGAGWSLTREIATAGPEDDAATLVRYRFESTADDPGRCELTLRPWLPCREADSLTFANGECDLGLDPVGQAAFRCRPYAGLPAVAIAASRPSVSVQADPIWRHGLELPADLARGYDGHEDHPSPGTIAATLESGESIVIALSLGDPVADPAEAWDAAVARVAAGRRSAAKRGSSSVRNRIDSTATDFLYRTEHGRLGICAGYPWFGEWGRDTFISLPGLTLARGDEQACREVLDGAIPFLQNGLLPNIYGASRDDSHYGSVDASLWFARAAEIHATRVPGARSWALEVLRPALREIATAYRDGTDLGVGANADGLIEAGGPDLNATWMDANASDGPVTPRDGCAVEINGLWYALLDHLAELEDAAGDDSAPWVTARDRAGKAFLERFWLRDEHYLADRFHDGEADRRVRPNMVLAAALARSPLKSAMRKGIVDVATERLLTPRGLRTLSPEHPDYVARYRGGPDERDRAYHQGTVWPWLLGFYTEACLLARNSAVERARLQAIWDGFAPELDRAGLEHISEVFDGDPPHAPGGTIAQAWNSAELLRSVLATRAMTDIVFYFQVHQPYRLQHGTFRDKKGRPQWFDDGENKRILQRVAERCYLPMNALLAELIESTDKRFKCSFSISGTVLSQMEKWSPETVDSFVKLAETGCVEFLSETSMHSMTFDIDPDEFERQVREHRAKIHELFGREPTTFRNTELVIDESVARRIEDFGFEVLLGEGADQLLHWRSPLYVYRPRGCWKLALMLRCYPFSDDIGFRFSNKEWEEYPLYADKFADWLHKLPADAHFVGLYMDYETFGEHQWEDTGIFEFMRYMPKHLLEDERFGFATPAEIARRYAPVADIEIPRPISWADEERDLSAWRGNPMQAAAAQAAHDLGPKARRAAEAGHPELYRAWQKMTTSDHTYYMSTKFASDGDVHEYFSPYPGPRDAYLNYMDALDDLNNVIDERLEGGSTAAAKTAPPPSTRRTSSRPKPHSETPE